MCQLCIEFPLSLAFIVSMFPWVKHRVQRRWLRRKSLSRASCLLSGLCSTDSRGADWQQETRKKNASCAVRVSGNANKIMPAVRGSNVSALEDSERRRTVCWADCDGASSGSDQVPSHHCRDTRIRQAMTKAWRPDWERPRA
jgi:hypothetical protein